ncbi:hypothetical protein [Roseomonas fluvialis]|uniref:Uncharacterized protein n=1 Tax=Roseomonas fluvialis TaxID=1750527 RepID=A0ABN6P414_9PROT|nr:hypothetical protein [Roseomonas fluvialis]BDG73161.1 hypothetical protein Rmf_30900 [Roseomonas fluvialis]
MRAGRAASRNGRARGLALHAQRGDRAAIAAPAPPMIGGGAGIVTIAPRLRIARAGVEAREATA